MTHDLCRDFADFTVDTAYEKLPTAAIEAAKKSILDTLGVILAASGVEPAVRGVVELVRESGGRPESSVLAFGGRVPAVSAAFANGAMAHCLDFDDHTPWGQHASSSIVPALLAVAERKGGVSGKEMIAAVAAGQDIFARLRCNVGWRKDWNLSTVMGVFSATAAVGRILGFSKETMNHALGIALMQSCGTMEVVYGVGSNLRGMYAGFSAKGAVLAALLAEKGITGVGSAFEGKYGFFNTYFDGKYDRSKMVEGLGRDYLGGGTLYKPWPSVGTSHGHIHATIQLVKAQNLGVADIKEIRAYVGDYHEIMCEPLEARRAPATLVDAKFSLPFLVAVAAVRRDVRISDFTAKALKDPEVLAVAQKVIPVPDPSFNWSLELPTGRVEILTTDGRTFERTGTHVPGHEDAPLSWDDICRKFADCASVAVVAPSPEKIARLQKMARDLDQLDDVAELTRVLV